MPDTAVLTRAEGTAPTPPAVSGPPAPAAERYRDEGLLARGGMSEVRRVWDTRFGVVVAMKLLRHELVGDTMAEARFAAEIAVTARLQHPGVVAVYDEGTDPAGRPWFTMSEVRGDTFTAVIARAHAAGPPDDTMLHGLVQLLERACEAVAYAHGSGIVHRDLKPDNLMIGAFGEVRVMDWGIARLIGAGASAGAEGAGALVGPVGSGTAPGEIVGTPAFMAPEQARGEVEVGPAADVYALGGVLHQVLTGRSRMAGGARAAWAGLRSGDLPPVLDPPPPGLPAALVELCRRSLSFPAADRPKDAGVLAAALRDWLDGAQRRAEALALVAKASAQLPVLGQLRAEVEALRKEADSRLAAVAPADPVDALLPAWALQDRAAAVASEVTLREVALHQDLRAALSRAPELPEAHALLADHYRDALARAEADRDALAIARNEVLLRAHDRGRHAAFLQGDGALTLHTTAPVHARLFRYVEEGRRLVPRFERDLGETPLRTVTIPKGSWLVTLEGPGGTVRYPVRIDRAAHWDGVAPGEAEPTPIWVPGPEELAADEVYVPAGWCLVGGDPYAADSLPRQSVWVDGFIVGRFPVTLAQYARFLEAHLAEGGEAALAAMLPGPLDGKPAFVVEHGRIFPAAPHAPHLPVTGITHAAAAEAARWLGGQLPNELELEKAARGVDGRLTPWGSQIEARWSRVIGSSPSPPWFLPVGSIASDESPYGVRDLAGNARSWCRNWWSRSGPILNARVVDAPDEGTHRAVRGGFYGSPPPTQRSATRFGLPQERAAEAVGLRVIRAAARWEWPSSARSKPESP